MAPTHKNLTEVARELVLAGATNEQLWEAFVTRCGVDPNDTKKRGYPAWYRAKIMREAGLGKAPKADDATLTALVQKAVDGQLAALRAELATVKAAAATARPTVLEVRVETAKAVKRIEGAHFLMPRLVKLLGAGLPVYLWGPAGSGKTTAALQAATALAREAEIDTLDPSTFRSMVQGFMTPDAAPVHTAFTRCWTEGKVYVADETDNAPGHVQTLFNSALANGHAPLAWGNVARHAGFGFVGTGNTPGRPTREFPDRRPMSAAFADRLYFVHWPLDPAIECRAGGLTPPRPPTREARTCKPEAWVSFVQRLRAWVATGAPTIMVTPRASLVGLQALALGETPAEAADGLIFRGCDAELKAKALSAVPLPVEA